MRRTSNKIKKILAFLGIAAKFAFAAGFLGFIVLAIIIYAIDTPDLENFKERRVIESTKIYDRTGKILLYDIHGEEKRTVIKFENIPRHIKNATIALEDDNFYKHWGFRPFAFGRAIFVNLMRGSFEQGGSTITQQVVKNTLLTSEKTILRKLREIVISLKLERKYEKDEILSFYLNQIPYGNNAYGIEAAAETFFGKHAEELNLLETAYLISLPKAPSYYSPYGKHRKELDARAEFTLNRMKELGFVSEEEFEKAKKENLIWQPARAQGIIAPHFVIEVREELNNRFGEDEVEIGGFKVTTTLDVDLQTKSEEIIEKYAPTIEKNFNAKNAASVAIDPKTGDILAMVGSRDYFELGRDGNFNVTTALRQPGSAIKPFVYATALKKGFTPETAVFDLPTEFNPACTKEGKPTWADEASPKYTEEEKKCYHPKNYDEKFRGPVSFREALAQSLNVPSVKVLYLAGLDDSLLTSRDFGITSLNDPARFGLTLVLGGGEVSPLELTSAFGVFANDGTRNPHRYILKIEDKEGKTLYEAESQPREVIDKNIARAISDILSDNEARAPAFGESSALYFPGKQVAAKTGTTNDYRDAWVLGYTPEIVIGTWAGNNDNASMEKKVAGFIVAPMWHEIMEYALTKQTINGFIKPEKLVLGDEDQKLPSTVLRGEWRGGKEFVIDKISGRLATEFTPEEFKERKVIQEVHSILYWLGRRDDPQFRYWEEGVRAWAATNGYLDQPESVIPTEYDNVHIPENFPKIKSLEILPKKDYYELGDKIFVKTGIENKYSVSQIDYFGGPIENFIGSEKQPPWEFGIEITTDLVDEYNQIPIKLKIYDSVGNKVEETTTLNLSI